MHRIPIALASIVMLTACGGARPTADPVTTTTIDARRFGFVPEEFPPEMRLDVATEGLEWSPSGLGRVFADDDWVATRGATGRAVGVFVESDYTSLPFDFEAAPTDRIDGKPAITGTNGGLTWIAWKFCPFDGCDHDFKAAVIGYETDAAEVRRIAAAATITRDVIELPEGAVGLPERARERFSVDALFTTDGNLGGGHPLTMRWLAREPSADAYPVLDVSQYDAGSPVSTFVRFALGSGAARDVRGHSGAAGAPIEFGGDWVGHTRVWIWDEGGVTIVVRARDLAPEVAERVIASLHPARADDWTALRIAAREPEIPRSSSEFIAASGSFDYGSWSVTLDRFEANGTTYYGLSEDVRTADAAFSGGSGSHSLGGPGIGLGFDNSDAGVLFYGTLPNDVDALEIVLADGRTLTATIAPIAAGWPERPWGAFTTDVVPVAGATARVGDRVAFVLDPPAPLEIPPGSASGWALTPR